MKILITGGAGFIASHIAETLQGKAEIRVLDNLRTGYRRNLDGLNVEFVEGSITDPAIVQQAVQGVDYVFHLAAMISVPESMGDPGTCVDINVQGLLNVLDASARAGVKKLCFSSSSAIYGENPESPKHEDMTPDPRSPYAVTKLDGEYYGDLFTREGRLACVSLRYFNVFGPRQDPKSAYAAAIPIFLDKAVKGEPLTIFGDGEQTRDFVYVKDIAAANIYFCTESDATGTYNIGYGASTTVNALAQQIIDTLGSSSTIEHAPIRAGDVKHSCASIAKARAAGFEPQGDFEGGLGETVRFYLEDKKIRR
jgi:UDP-glucose 4-epimerase